MTWWLAALSVAAFVVVGVIALSVVALAWLPPDFDRETRE